MAGFIERFKGRRELRDLTEGMDEVVGREQEAQALVRNVEAFSRNRGSQHHADAHALERGRQALEEATRQREERERRIGELRQELGIVAEEDPPHLDEEKHEDHQDSVAA